MAGGLSSSALRRARAKRTAARRRDRARFETGLRHSTILVCGRVKEVVSSHEGDSERAGIEFVFTHARLEAFLKHRRITLCSYAGCPHAEKTPVEGSVALSLTDTRLCRKDTCVLTVEHKL